MCICVCGMSECDECVGECVSDMNEYVECVCDTV